MAGCSWSIANNAFSHAGQHNHQPSPCNLMSDNLWYPPHLRAGSRALTILALQWCWRMSGTLLESRLQGNPRGCPSLACLRPPMHMLCFQDSVLDLQDIVPINNSPDPLYLFKFHAQLAASAAIQFWSPKATHQPTLLD